jgi:RimJ/RimL family protein N-acetyltransferase
MDSAYSIRNTCLEDIERVTEINVLAWQESYRGIIDQVTLDAITVEDRLEQREEFFLNQQNALFLVALHNDEIIGFCDAGPIRNHPWRKTTPSMKNIQSEIYAIYLLEQHKGKGEAQDLFRASTNWLTINALHPFMVCVLKGNTPARKFYEKMGGIVYDRTTLNIDNKNYNEVVYIFDN